VPVPYLAEQAEIVRRATQLNSAADHLEKRFEIAGIDAGCGRAAYFNRSR
jgi:hypothetical protein